MLPYTDSLGERFMKTDYLAAYQMFKATGKSYLTCHEIVFKERWMGLLPNLVGEERAKWEAKLEANLASASDDDNFAKFVWLDGVS